LTLNQSQLEAAITPVNCHIHTPALWERFCKFVLKKMTTEQKEQLNQALTSAFDNFIEALSQFDETVVNEIPFAGSWTPAQVAQHIILATDGLPDGKNKPADRAFDALLPKIRPWWEDFTKKLKSPPPLVPDKKSRSKEELLSELKRVRAKDLAIVATQDLTVICLDSELPSIGYLTRYEWLEFIRIHLGRHTFQLNNMR
jgi:hypothetical protein